MKIPLKISEKQLSAIVYAFKEIPKVPPKERNAKVAKSVLDKVALKFKKKQLEIHQGVNLFNTKQKFSFSLELVEAHFLEQYLAVMADYPMSEYDHNVINLIRSNLHQQLC